MERRGEGMEGAGEEADVWHGGGGGQAVEERDVEVMEGLTDEDEDEDESERDEVVAKDARGRGPWSVCNKTPGKGHVDVAR